MSKDAKQRDVVKSGEALIDAATFEKVWKAWQPSADLPKVDFAT